MNISIQKIYFFLTHFTYFKLKENTLPYPWSHIHFVINSKIYLSCFTLYIIFFSSSFYNVCIMGIILFHYIHYYILWDFFPL